MAISPTQNSPIFLGPPIKIEDTLSSYEIEARLVESFQNLDFNGVREMVSKGGNPDQIIPLSKAIVLEYVKLNVLGAQDAEGQPVEFDFDQFAQNLMQDEQLYNGCVEQFFGGEVHHPMLLLSSLLNNDDLSLFLLENGAGTAFASEAEDGFKLTILELGTRCRLPKTVAYSIMYLEMKPNQTMGEDYLSPFSIALIEGNTQMMKIFLELAPQDADLSLFAIPEFVTFWNDNEDLEPMKELFEEYGVELPEIQ